MQRFEQRAIRRGYAASAVIAASLLGPGLGGLARAEDCRRVPPTQFGRVYRTNRSALVRVRAENPRSEWSDGVVIGARGEVLFGIGATLGSRVRVRLDGGFEHGALVLGFDRALGVAVARLEGPGAPALVPPAVALDAALTPECWMVALTHDDKGAPTSHAGQVVRRAKGGTVEVDVPGRRGSPVFSADGALVAVSVRRGRRRVRVRPMAALMPFLERVVIGARP